MTILETIASRGCGCDRQDVFHSLTSIDEALSLIAAHVARVGRIEAVSLEGARGRILARRVRSRSMAPAFDNAAMDGYAVATSAFAGAGPWALRVVARVPAGQKTTATVVGAAAARIFTGALIPAGADAVVMQEDVRSDGDLIHLSRRPAPDQNIRRAGNDMAKGDLILDKGCRLGPREIAACAAAGAGIMRVRPRLRVALLVTGDEVRRAGGARKAAQIWDINTPMLAASLEATGAAIVATIQGADELTDLVAQLGEMAAQADLFITMGGVSVGEEDHVKPAVAALAGETLFSGVAIKLGKPVSVGRIGEAQWLGLPGNPLSAYVTWQLFGMAMIRALNGEVAVGPTRRHVVIATEVRRKPGRCELRTATLAGFDAQGREVVSFEDATHSGRVGRLPLADGLMFLPADADCLPEGALVEFQPFGQI